MNNSLPTEDDVGRSLRYLAETDELFAKQTGHMKALEYQVKTIKALEYLDSEGTIAEREAKSCSSAAYRAFTNDYENAVASRETTAAKRKRAELTIAVWQSINANVRAGMMR